VTVVEKAKAMVEEGAATDKEAGTGVEAEKEVEKEKEAVDTEAKVGSEEAKEEGAWEAPVVDLDSVKEKRAEREAAETAEE
jgi:hypothetical protein